MNSRDKNTSHGGGGQGFRQFPLISNPLGLLLPIADKGQPIRLSQPVRKIRSNPRSVTGMVPFQGLRRQVRFESSNERDFLLQIRDSSIPLGVLEQPLTINPTLLGFNGRRYTPDFAVWILDPYRHSPITVLVEIKPDSLLLNELPWYRQRLMAARRFCRNNGWTFRLITERRFRSSEVPAVIWPQFHVPPIPLLHPSLLIHRLFPEVAL